MPPPQLFTVATRDAVTLEQRERGVGEERERERDHRLTAPMAQCNSGEASFHVEPFVW